MVSPLPRWGRSPLTGYGVLPGVGLNPFRYFNIFLSELCAFVADLPVEAVPDDQVLESGWEELGISDDRAAEIASELADEEGAPGGIDFYKVRTCPILLRGRPVSVSYF